MSDVLSQVKSNLTNAALEKIAAQAGISRDKADSLTETLLPLIIGGLAKNTTSDSGAKALEEALQRDHDGSILQQVEQYLERSDGSEGAKILTHIFGQQETEVERAAATLTDSDPSAARQVMTLLAPLVLGALGEKKQASQWSASDLANVLQQEKTAAKAQSVAGSILTAVLDKDKDGDFKDDLLTMLIDFVKKLFSKKK